jgi:hypothetical protein
MRSLLIGISLGFVMSSSSFAQEMNTFDCQEVGNNTPEALGAEGQTILTDNFACRVTTGSMQGANMTGTAIWNFNKTDGTLVSGTGVMRKPGSVVVYKDDSGTLKLATDDKGNVTGASGAGKATWLVATGAAASGAGKTWNWTVKSTGPGRFTVSEPVE